ncbi:MAG: hypothetical protein ACRDKE_05070, partial [Solirubrobacterales bacterium]
MKTPLRLVLVLILVLAAAGAAIGFSQEDNPEEESVVTQESALARQLRAKHAIGPDVVRPEANAKALKSCNEAEPDSTEIKLPNARLYYRDWEGEEPAGGAELNRAAGCFYETRRITEFGFSDVIEGEAFGIAKGAGDFVAYSTVTWEAADGSSDGFSVWNLKTGTPVVQGAGCGAADFDCSVSDIALTSDGSFAYVVCRDNGICSIYLKRAGEKKRQVVDQIERSESSTLRAERGLLRWTD